MHRFVVSRRTVLVGGAATALLAACGSGGSSSSTTTASTPDTAAANFSLIDLFDPNSLLISGSVQRAPFAVGDKDGVVVKDSPDTLTFTVTSAGRALGSPIDVARHDKDLPRPYYPLEFTPPGVGTYTVKTVINGTPALSTFTVSEPSAVKVPRPGQSMPALKTPTVSDHAGVDPICTRSPQCPLHSVSLDTAVKSGKPVAFIVATPKYCQVAICGPVLDVLLGLQSKYPSVTMIHAEVWTDDKTTTPAPAVSALNLTYEPVLFLVGPDGQVRQRVDTIFDTTEVDAALRALTA